MQVTFLHFAQSGNTLVVVVHGESQFDLVKSTGTTKKNIQNCSLKKTL